MATEDLEWERSKISNQDLNLLKRLVFTKEKDALRFPREESYPKPPMEYRVSFVDHLIRGLSPPIHEFLRGLLFVYGLQLHQLTPNPILHVSIFITLVTLFYLLFLPFPKVGKSKNGLLSPTTTRVLLALKVESGIPINPRLLLKKRLKQKTRSSLPAASPKGKRKRDEAIDSGASKATLTAEEETLDLYGAALVSSDDEEEDAPIDETARTSTSQLVRFGTQFIGYRDYAGELEGKLAEANKRADALAIELEQSKSAHAKVVEDLQTRLDDAKRALEENVAQHSAREEEILSRLETQSRRFVRRTHQEYELDNPEDDELLDAISLLEIHGTEAHNGLDEAEAGLSRLFPYFFHKKERPAVFIDLAKCFNGNEDLGLQLRQEGLKVGVEGTMALVAESQQEVDWSKVGDTGKIETKKWQSLIKAAKPNSKKILATLGYNPPTTPSSSKPEVK
ncbi:hypothetical protein QYE76_031212 [Lolium multiflorum]|uniref:Transposase (putative) gypsy type domain-containing protein n=1 Tax=Lolium multiflorum TaxID=4521 RepID=A0AAD8QT32_LOLMU|nr:hypothetical protein QYE76_031212 [Lolium multiflorum]